MSKKLNWIDVLNEQVSWQSRADFRQWFSSLVGRPTSFIDASIESFEEALGFMRRQISNLHFGEPVDLLWLDTQLKTVSLGLLHHQGSQPGTEANLPRFRARVKGMVDADLLRAVKDTLLVQFADFIGDSLDNADNAPTVARCEGVYRTSTKPPVPANASYPGETELRWRQEIPVLAGEGEGVSELSRCPSFFPHTPKAKFCSDACRFSTFQLAKQTQEPGYLAEKQRRYRKRQEK